MGGEGVVGIDACVEHSPTAMPTAAPSLPPSAQTAGGMSTVAAASARSRAVLPPHRWFAPLPLSLTVAAAFGFTSGTDAAATRGVVPACRTSATPAAHADDLPAPASQRRLGGVDWAVVWAGAVKRQSGHKKLSIMSGLPAGAPALAWAQGPRQSDVKPVIPLDALLAKLRGPHAAPAPATPTGAAGTAVSV